MSRSASSRPVATGIPLQDLHLVWADVWPLLAPAIQRTPDKPDVLARLLVRDAQLWVVYDDDKPVAAIVTQITLLRRYAASESMSSIGPSGTSEDDALRSSSGAEKGCRLWLVGGSRVNEWAAELLAKLELWARSLGCVALWGSGREGWDRIVRRMGGSRMGTIAGFPAWERRL